MPTCTAEVPDFVEKHVHDNYILTAGVKSLPVHRHLLHVDKPTVLRKPPHTVHKVLKGGGGGGGGGGATLMSSQTTARRARDRISSHPYKHAAAAIASARRTDDDPSSDDGGGDERNISSSSMPSMFGVAGVIGGPEFDPYQKYRHDIFPFKEHLAPKVNKLVLEKRTWMHCCKKELLLPLLELEICMMRVLMTKVVMVTVAKQLICCWKMTITTTKVCCLLRQRW